jgi:hypothetical protein
MMQGSTDLFLLMFSLPKSQPPTPEGWDEQRVEQASGLRLSVMVAIGLHHSGNEA